MASFSSYLILRDLRIRNDIITVNTVKVASHNRFHTVLIQPNMIFMLYFTSFLFLIFEILCFYTQLFVRSPPSSFLLI